jgi:hypothetical protein
MKKITKFLNAYEPGHLDAVVDVINLLGDRDLVREILPLARKIRDAKYRAHGYVLLEKKRDEAARKLQPRSRIKKGFRKPKKELIREFSTMSLPVVGICPLCGKAKKGRPLPGCETRKSGRVWYEECTICPYYMELIKTKSGYTERGHLE